MITNITTLPAKPVAATEIFLVADDLKSSATFNYIHYAADGSVVGQSGQVVLSGEDYKSWDGSNPKALELVLAKLGSAPVEGPSIADDQVAEVQAAANALIAARDRAIEQLEARNAELSSRVDGLIAQLSDALGRETQLKEELAAIRAVLPSVE